MLVVCLPFCRCHVVIPKSLAGFRQTGRLRVRRNDAGLEILHPFLQRRDCHLVELVHTNQEVFGINLRRRSESNRFLFFHRDLQPITRMHADKMRLAMIQIIITLPQVKIKNTDAEIIPAETPSVLCWLA